MNAKKTPNPSLWLLDEAARRERLETDKRLIASEKASAGDPGITLLVRDQADEDDSTHSGQSLPQGLQDVFERLERGHDSTTVELIVQLSEWTTGIAELLAALRDRANRRIVVHVGEARIGDSIDQHLVSLGYRRLSATEAVYQFDIETYKDTPDWLNPRNWANPELWDKYRW